jgi:hypothetical protein
MQRDLRKEFLVSGRVMFGDGWAGKNNVSSRVLRGDGTEFCIGLIGYRNEGAPGGWARWRSRVWGARGVVIANGDGEELAELKRFDSRICRGKREVAAKLLDKEVALNYKAWQAITG